MGGGLRKVHEQTILGNEATLVRVNPVRDYGWNSSSWNGENSEKKKGDTERVIVQRLHGSDTHLFFTGDGEPLSEKTVPKFILDDIKKRPLTGELGGQVDTLSICKVCHEPYPSSIYPEHLEKHLASLSEATESAKK